MITICTPTYNRAYLLQRPFESLRAQTCKDFKWLIIDDGSTDETRSLVESFIKTENEFEIEYHYKENGGRHTALNFSYQYIDTEYVLNLDSDDALLPNAVELINNKIRKIKQLPNYCKLWQISFRSIDAETNVMVGQPYDLSINKLSGVRQRAAFLKVKGEKHNCRKCKILKQYPFPLYDGIKFVGENTVWDEISQYYDTYCTNDVISYYYQNSVDSLSRGGIHSDIAHQAAYNYYVFVINRLRREILFNSNVIKAYGDVPKHAILGNIHYCKVISDINRRSDKLLVTLGYLPAKIYLLVRSRNGKQKKTLV